MGKRKRNILLSELLLISVVLTVMSVYVSRTIVLDDIILPTEPGTAKQIITYARKTTHGFPLGYREEFRGYGEDSTRINIFGNTIKEFNKDKPPFESGDTYDIGYFLSDVLIYFIAISTFVFALVKVRDSRK